MGVTACGHGAQHLATARTVGPTTIPTEPTSTDPPTSVTAPPAPAAATSSPRTSPSARSTRTSATTVRTTTTTIDAASVLTTVGGNQAIVVSAPSSSATTATLTAYQRSAGHWTVAFGPWSARVGAKGVAAPGDKREGDLRTPAGTFGFQFLFGSQPNPGVHFPYRLTAPSVVWDDDPASPLYNEWVDTAAGLDAGANPEPMFVTPVYRYGAVIAYNTARTPSLGSGIFLHVTDGKATTGCISIPEAQLLSLLRWLDPAGSPAIVVRVV